MGMCVSSCVSEGGVVLVEQRVMRGPRIAATLCINAYLLFVSIAAIRPDPTTKEYAVQFQQRVASVTVVPFNDGIHAQATPATHTASASSTPSSTLRIKT